MKRKPEFVVLALWTIAIVATLLVARDGAFTYLAPLFAVCAVGSVFTVRKARHLSR
jgi:hypothetical protein